MVLLSKTRLRYLRLHSSNTHLSYKLTSELLSAPIGRIIGSGPPITAPGKAAETQVGKVRTKDRGPAALRVS